MKVNQQAGNRLKTPGGVFISLLKSHEGILDEVKTNIFQEEKAGRKFEKKQTKELVNSLEKSLSIF